MPRKRVVRCTVHVSCAHCGFDIGQNKLRKLKDFVLTCENCGEQSQVPPSAIHDAQNQCLVALGEAD